MIFRQTDTGTDLTVRLLSSKAPSLSQQRACLLPERPLPGPSNYSMHQCLDYLLKKRRSNSHSLLPPRTCAASFSSTTHPLPGVPLHTTVAIHQINSTKSPIATIPVKHLLVVPNRTSQLGCCFGAACFSVSSVPRRGVESLMSSYVWTSGAMEGLWL